MRPDRARTQAAPVPAKHHHLVAADRSAIVKLQAVRRDVALQHGCAARRRRAPCPRARERGTAPPRRRARRARRRATSPGRPRRGARVSPWRRGSPSRPAATARRRSRARGKRARRQLRARARPPAAAQKSHSGCRCALRASRLACSPAEIARQNDAHGRAVRQPRQAAVEQRIVVEDGLAADEDGVGARAHEMALRAGCLARGPGRRPPAPRGTEPSAPSASFSCTSGRRSVTRRMWPAAIQCASPAIRPRSTAMPAARNLSSPRPATRGSGSSMAHTTRAIPAAHDRIGAGRRLAVVRAGLERDVHGGAARAVSGTARALPSPRADARRERSSRARSPRLRLHRR